MFLSVVAEQLPVLWPVQQAQAQAQSSLIHSLFHHPLLTVCEKLLYAWCLGIAGIVPALN